MDAKRKLELKIAEAALARIAEENGVTLEEVQSQIMVAIEVGRSSTDPEVQKRWESIPCAGGKPTPEELIVWVMNQLREGGEVLVKPSQVRGQR